MPFKDVTAFDHSLTAHSDAWVSAPADDTTAAPFESDAKMVTRTRDGISQGSASDGRHYYYVRGHLLQALSTPSCSPHPFYYGLLGVQLTIIGQYPIRLAPCKGSNAYRVDLSHFSSAEPRGCARALLNPAKKWIRLAYWFICVFCVLVEYWS